MKRSGPAWVAVLVVGVAVGGLAVGGLVGAAIGVALGAQALVAARRWAEVGQGARTLVVRTIPAMVGWAVIVVAVDAGAGVLLDRARGVEDEVDADRLELAGVELPPTDDPRVDTPAYRGADWAERLFEEMDALEYEYVPFIGPRVRAVRGRYITSQDGIRRSYEPEGADGGEAVEVWFFGGSTMWGEGQRDLHTIPSEVARLAEAEGTALRAVNYGERGYTAFQEFLLFEQELARHGPPDLAVFYDGINETGVQQETVENISEQPTIFQLATVLDGLRRAPPLPGEGPPPEASLLEDYEQTSALHKLLRQLDLLSAAGAQEEDGRFPEFEPEQFEQAVRNARALYRRAIDLIRGLSRRWDTPVLHFWQPHQRGNEGLEALARDLPRGVIDISDAFLGPSEDAIFIDGAHTNELGARLSAEAIWEHLHPALASPRDQ